MSNNGGQDWAEVANGNTHVFTTTGSDLRWRAELTANDSVTASPVIDDLSITYSTEPLPAWSLLVYMSCDADAFLDIACQRAMGSLQQAATNPYLNIIALYDNPGANNSYRYHIQPDGQYIDGVNRWYLGEKDMADRQTLADFIQWGRTNYPAPHTALSIMGHGLGHAALGWDWQTAPDTYLKPTPLRTAIYQGTDFGAEPLDLILYDACLMGLIEQAYQLDGLADVMVASENLIWLPFPYHQLETLVNENTDANTLATGMVSMIS